jgi:ribosomal protein S18 acetylase RimI-like enzyme
MQITVKYNKENKGKICGEVLATIPQWFGIDEANQNYIIKIESQPMFVAEADGKVAGFLGLEIHNQYSAEIYVMGIKPEYHRKGIGTKLIKVAEKYLRRKKIEYLQVKTLGSSHPDENYKKTRLFYLAVGFRPIEEFENFWFNEIPCLMLMKNL